MKFHYAIVLDKKLHKFESDDKDRIVLEIVDFFVKNNHEFDLKDLHKAIDRQSKIKIIKKHKISLSQAIHGASAIMKNAVFGSSVSAKEMQRRAAICNECPMSNMLGGCQACGAGAKITNFANKLRTTVGSAIPIPSEIKSKFCDHCGCALASMVVTKYENFYEESDEDQVKRPDACWLKKNSPNFTHE